MTNPIIWIKLEQADTDVAEIRRLLAQVPDHYVISDVRTDNLVMVVYFIDPALLEPGYDVTEGTSTGKRLIREII